MITLPNGFNPTENSAYILKCSITVSSPNPITRYECLQDSNRVDGNTDTLLFSAVKRNGTGS